MYLFSERGQDLEIEKSKNGSAVRQTRGLFSCEITSKIMSITARVSNSDFISGIKFNDENGETLCSYWNPASDYWNPTSWNHTENYIAHNGYFLSHLTGFEDDNFNGIVNGINFVWKKLVTSTNTTTTTTTSTSTTTTTETTTTTMIGMVFNVT